MKLALFYNFLIVSYVFIYVVLSTTNPRKSKKRKREVSKKEIKEISREEMMMRETLFSLTEALPSGSQRVPIVLLDIIANYNKEVTWKAKRLDPREVEGQEFKEDIFSLFINDSNIPDHIIYNNRKLSYDRQSENLIIEEQVKCPDGSMKTIREKRLRFVITEWESINVYLRNNHLVTCGELCEDEFYRNIDIYDLSNQEFWEAEFKINSKGKTILSGNESYGTHIRSNILYSAYDIGIWKDEKEEYVVIPLRTDDTGFEKYIDKDLKENRKDPNNDNLVIGVHENIVIMDLASIKAIKHLYGGYNISFTNDGQIMRIQEGEKKGNEPLAIYYKIYQE